MAECIICATEYEEGSIEICSNCGFDLTPFPEFLGEYPNFWLKREQTQIDSVRQMWVNFQETKQKLLETLTIQSESHNLEIKKLNSQLVQNNNTVIQLNNQLKKLEKSYVNLREELNRKIREKTVIQSELKSAEESIGELNNKNANLARRYEELESKFNDLQKKFRAVTELKTFHFETVQLTEKEVVEGNEMIEMKIETRKIPKQAQYFTEELGNGVTLDMIHIPAGSFMMGTDDEEIARLCKEFGHNFEDFFKWEAPQHRVTLSAFYMGKYPITQAQYEAIMGNNPSRFKGNNNPVENISWEMAQEFCQKLSEKTGKEYQLPSEAQWEYGCRAGTTTPFYFGETLTDELANYDAKYIYVNGKLGKYREQTTPVRTFPPNGFGLYDMHGNVWEWCRDSWHENYKNAPRDGSAWIDKSRIFSVTRGGSWDNFPDICRCASRFKMERYKEGYIGFRIVSCIGSNF